MIDKIHGTLRLRRDHLQVQMIPTVLGIRLTVNLAFEENAPPTSVTALGLIDDLESTYDHRSFTSPTTPIAPTLSRCRPVAPQRRLSAHR